MILGGEYFSAASRSTVQISSGEGVKITKINDGSHHVEIGLEEPSNIRIIDCDVDFTTLTGFRYFNMTAQGMQTLFDNKNNPGKYNIKLKDSNGIIADALCIRYSDAPPSFNFMIMVPYQSEVRIIKITNTAGSTELSCRVKIFDDFV